MILLRSLLMITMCSLAVGCTPKPAAIAQSPHTLAIINAKIWTGDAQRPSAEALLIDGDRIVLVGTSAQIKEAAGTVETIDAQGRMITPGFTDSHVHFVEAGLRLASVQLRDAHSRDELAARIKTFAATLPEGEWITGGDWDHSYWGGELPTREWIDAATGTHPAWINRLDGHMALANTAALKVAKITKATPAVDGGEIIRNNNGEPTGILKDNAMQLVESVVPAHAHVIEDRALAAAMKYVNERGVTSVQNMGTWENLAVFARAAKAKTLTTRIYAAVPLVDWRRLKTTVQAKTYGGDDGRGDEWLGIGGLKGYMDGSLGSHTAALIEPYTDAPKDRGLFRNSPEHMNEWIEAADKAGLNVMVHAIGDRANSLLLDIYERVEKQNGPRDRRFRIEHAQHLLASDIPRFAQLDVIASMQPYHIIDDGRWAEKLIGNRIKTSYAYRSLLDSKAKLVFGSDWYVAPPTPLDGVYAAVTRRTLDDKNPAGWVPEQKITVQEALVAYTVTPAYASFEEDIKGTLSVGKLADLVMLDRDIFAVAPEKIRDAKVLLTMVGGKIVFRAP